LEGHKAKFLHFLAPLAKIFKILKAKKPDFSNFVLRLGIFFALISSKKTQNAKGQNLTQITQNAMRSPLVLTLIQK